MIIKRILTLQTTIPNVVEVLQKHIRSKAPHGHVNNSDFCLYKINKTKYKKLAVLFVVSGKINGANNEVQITIKVRPCITVFLLTVLFAAILTDGLILFIFGSATLKYAICAIGFNLLFHLVYMWQMRECLSRLIEELETISPLAH